jgi:hypothetical protein
MNMNSLATSQIFNNYAVAFGAIMGGLGGAVAVYRWSAKFKEDLRRSQLETELKIKISS